MSFNSFCHLSKFCSKSLSNAVARVLLAAVVGSLFSVSVMADDSNQPFSTQALTMNIVMEIDGKQLTGTLNDSAAAKDFAAMMPLELTLDDYASTEKVSDLPDSLSTADSPSGTAAKAGDITYYAPWGNLAIFYKPFRHASGLVKLGSFDDGANGLTFSGKKRVTIRLSD